MCFYKQYVSDRPTARPTADRSHNISRNIGAGAVAGAVASVDMVHLIGSNVMPGTNGKRRQADSETNIDGQGKGIVPGH